MSKYDIGNTSYSAFMNEKEGRYTVLVNKAELTNRNNGGIATAEEGNFYREAVEVCDEIINRNLSQKAVVSIWKSKKKMCADEIDRIVNELKKVKAEEQKNEIPVGAGKPADSAKTSTTKKDAEGNMVTKSGFKTRNACKEVSAETIEKWYKEAPTHSFEDIVGMEAQKKILENELRNLDWKKTDELLNISPVKGFLFYGPPGTGKTYIIEAFVSELMKRGFKYLRLLGGDIKQGLVGAAEKTVEAVFAEARDNDPCIVFIDEFEDVCQSRSNPNIKSHERSTTVAFLQAYNMLKESGKRAIFIGATNYPNSVDDAMTDRIHLVRVPLPDEAIRAEYFKKAFKNSPFDDNQDKKDSLNPDNDSKSTGVTIEDMVDSTDNYSFRDMEILRDAVNIEIRDIAVKEYQVLDENGVVDKEATDHAASEAIANGKITLTRILFEDARKANPPKNKDRSRAELAAFEEKMKRL